VLVSELVLAPVLVLVPEPGLVLVPELEPAQELALEWEPDSR